MADTHTETDRERSKLVAEQEKAEALIEQRKAEADKLNADGKPIPESFSDDVTEAAERVAELGAKIGEIDKAAEQRKSDTAEFYRTLALASGRVTETLKVRDGVESRVRTGRDESAVLGEGDRMITRETVDMLSEVLRDFAGSQGFRPRVNDESEDLIMRMISADLPERARRGGEWNEQARRINGMSKRTVLAGVDASGGYLVPQDNSFFNQVQMADAAYGGAKMLARTITTQTGSRMPIPTTNANLIIGEAKAEAAAVNDVDLTFDQEAMRAYMHTSGRLSASFEAVQDAGINLPMLLGMVGGEAINRIEAERFIRGNGTTQPQGLVIGYTEDAVTAAVAPQYARAMNEYHAGATTNPYAGWFQFLNALKYSVDAGYRRSPAFSLLLSDRLDQGFSSAVVNPATTGGDQRPLFERWAMGNSARGMGMDFGGFRVLSDFTLGGAGTVNANGRYVDGFVGDFNWFWLRRVAGMFMIEDPYTGAANMERRWVFGRRCDARCLFNTNTAAVAARSGNTPASAGRSAAIAAIRPTAKA